MIKPSLLISTYNWPSALAAVLATVRRQRVLPLEVLIADDGSRDDTAALVRAVQATYPVPVHHYWQPDEGFRKTRILNEALAHAAGDYVIQIDGDMLLHPEFVASHIRCATPGWYLQGSRVMLSEVLTARCIAQQEIPSHPVFAAGVRNRINAIHAPLLAGLVRGPRDAIKRTRGCNVSFWKLDLFAVNGWNEAFEGWGREDPELAARLQNSGVRRRNLKFLAVAFHLEHRRASAAAVAGQHEQLLETIASGRRVCERGVAQHRAP